MPVAIISKPILLSNGGTFTFDGKKISYTLPYTNTKNDVPLSADLIKILTKFLMNDKQVLSYQLLYESYSLDTDSVSNEDPNIRHCVQIMISKLKKLFKGTKLEKAIENVHNTGYRFCCPPNINETEILSSSEESPIEEKSDLNFMLNDLIGDYYAFYLDPLGRGTVLGGYLHLEKSDNSNISIYAILDIRSDTSLNNAKEIFECITSNYISNYHEFKKKLSSNEKRCSWAQGIAYTDSSLAILELKVTPESKWIIIIDMSNYLGGYRAHDSDNDRYRGGLCLGLTLGTRHGTNCFKVGLVRNLHRRDSINLQNSELRDLLKIQVNSFNEMWKPLELNKILDNQWYDWMMNQ